MVTEYLELLNKSLKNVNVNIITDGIDKTNKIFNSRVFIIGNGGSSSIASHFVQDLIKICHINATCLTDNSAAVTAYANDEGYTNIFSKQLEVMSTSINDIIIAFSCSGKSPNILEAEYWCVKHGRKFYCVHGSTDQKYYYENSDIAINSQNYGVLESAFDLISHYVVSQLVKNLNYAR